MSLYTFIKILKKLQKEAPQITDITISGFGEAFLDETIIDKMFQTLFSDRNSFFKYL